MLQRYLGCRIPAVSLLIVSCVGLMGCENSREVSNEPQFETGQLAEGETSDELSPDSGRVETGDNQREEAVGADPILAPVTVKLASYSDVMNFVARQSGSVVVLDVWSTSCIPCMQEFPNLVALSKRYDTGLVCVSLNVDYIGLKKQPAESYLPRIEKFLVSNEATFMNFVSNEPDDSVRELLGVTSIPAILVFDRNGKIVHRLTEATASGESLTYADDVVPAVEALMAKAP